MVALAAGLRSGAKDAARKPAVTRHPPGMVARSWGRQRLRGLVPGGRRGGGEPGWSASRTENDAFR